MRRYIKGFFMSFGMFTAIPVPYRKWDDECINLILPCFPLIGAVVGVLWYGAACVLVPMRIHTVLVSVFIMLIPFCVTGFLHLDGYMDTNDALMSRRPLEDMLRILKDPHTGAFAVITLIVLFFLFFAGVFSGVSEGKNMALLLFIPIVSRCCCSLALITLPALPQSGYGAMLKKNVKMSHAVFIVSILGFALTLAYIFCGIVGVLALAAAMAGFMAANICSYRRLGGMSGDLAGHSLVICEACAVIAWAVL